MPHTAVRWCLIAISSVTGLAVAACFRSSAETPVRRLEARLEETSAYRACSSLQPALGPLARPPCVTLRPAAGAAKEPFRRRPLLDQIRWMLDRSADHATLKRASEYLAVHAGKLPPPAAELAAAALLHGEAVADGDPGPLIEALGHAQRGVDLAPRSPAAQFNRALILADLGLCRQARSGFKAVLATESDAGWRAEALARLDQLPCQPGAARAAGPDAWFRTAVEERLGAWAGSNGEFRVVAAERVEIGRLGAQLAAAGDPFVTRLAAELDRSAPDRTYAAAVANLVEGRAAFGAGRYEAAAPLLVAAVAQLEGRRSLLVPWCRIWRAGLAIRTGDWPAVDELLGSSAEMSAAGPRVEGQRLWALGLARLRQGKLGLALAHFTQAETMLDRAGYREATASIRTLRAETLARLGLPDESWRPRLLAIRELQSPRPPFTLHNALVEGAELADRTRAPALADSLIAEARLLAEEQSDRTNRVEAMLFAAEIWQHRGERARAESTFRDAQREADRIEEVTIARIFGAAAALGLWKTAARDSATVEPLLSVLRFYAGHGPAWQEIDAERALARWHVGMGDLPAAERDLARAAAVAARQGDAVQDDQRTSAQARKLLADRVRLALAARAPRRALDLFDTGGETNAAGKRRQAIDPRLTAGRPEVVLALLPLGDQVAWWRLADGDLESGVEPLGSWRIAAGEGSRQTPAQLERTYLALLGRPLASIAKERPLALVVGPALHRVPFAALRNPASGAHLIEERAIRFHESVHEALDMLEHPQPTSQRTNWRAVAVGAPQLGPALVPLFENLPRARQEAQEVAALYGPHSSALVGNAATATAVRTAMAGADVLHLAVHGVAGDGSASRSLALAAEPGVEGGGLTAPGDLLGPDAEPRLVVLSVCSSLGSAEGPGSALGLAQTFVSRHVPATVGTLWPLEDGLLAELALTFHRGLISGLSASEALRAAQREAIAKSGDEGCCGWAALQLIGDLPSTQVASVKEKEH